MLDGINLWLIMTAALMATASPGPSNVTIAATAISEGRNAALVLACGTLTGSFFWSISAALGLGAIMHANAWVLEIVRYFGAAYLLFLGFKSARSAVFQPQANMPDVTHEAVRSSKRLYLKGLALHLTNPKAILFFASLYAVAIPPGTPIRTLFMIVLMIGLQSAVVFTCYAVLFSNPRAAAAYLRLKRWFDGVFAGFFAYAGIKVLTTRI